MTIQNDFNASKVGDTSSSMVKTPTLEFHSYAEIFPLLGTTDLKELSNDIKKNGLLQPIVLFEGKVLDGRNRLLACELAGVEPRFTEYAGSDPVGYVVSLNLMRRHLNESQRAEVGLKLLPYYEKLAKERQAHGMTSPGTIGETLKANLPEAIGQARAYVAKMVNVSPRLISDAKFIQVHDPKRLEEIRAGKTTVNKVKQEIKVSEAIESRREISKDLPKLENVLHGDCLELIPTLKDKTVDCLIIDPPYGINFVSNWRDYDNEITIPIENDDLKSAINLLNQSLKLVNDKLKDNSHIYIFTSWKVLEYFLPVVRNYFKVKNVLVWNKLNHGFGDLSNYADKYELIIFAEKGKRLLNGSRDQNILEYSREYKLKHPTQKPVDLLKFLIGKSTLEGELVLDYFAGSGSTLLAAKQLNRNFIGIESEKDYVSLITWRLSNESKIE